MPKDRLKNGNIYLSNRGEHTVDKLKDDTKAAQQQGDDRRVKTKRHGYTYEQTERRVRKHE